MIIEERFRGQTNTLDALHTALDVFNTSTHYERDEWQRVAVLLTDGEPTIEPSWAWYGTDPCQTEYAVDVLFDAMDVYLWAGLIGGMRSDFLNCFAPYF